MIFPHVGRQSEESGKGPPFFRIFKVRQTLLESKFMDEIYEGVDMNWQMAAAKPWK